jgi:hypothetical protein
VTTAAPRIGQKLLRVIARLDDRSVPIAELNRRVGASAERFGLTRPSYERVRELVHLMRRLEDRRCAGSVLRVLVGLRAGLAGWPEAPEELLWAGDDVRTERPPASNSLLQAVGGQACSCPKRKQRAGWEIGLTIGASVGWIRRSSRS